MIDVATARFEKAVFITGDFSYDGTILPKNFGPGKFVTEVTEGTDGIRALTVMDGLLFIHYTNYPATLVPLNNVIQADRAVRK
jgi:hypothetical protein